MQHLFDALADGVALLVEGGELGLGGGEGFALRGALGFELGAECGYFVLRRRRGLRARVLTISTARRTFCSSAWNSSETDPG